MPNPRTTSLARTLTPALGLITLGLVTAGPPAWADAPRERGVARLAGLADLETVDPAAAWDIMGWQLEYATCAKLVDYADVDGQTVLVPGLAAAMPDVSADGRTYTFVVRPRSGFAPPSRELISAAVVKRSIERATDPDFYGPGDPAVGSFYMGDVEAIDVLPHDRLRFRLAAPAGDFLHRLALPFFCAVPSDYPAGIQDVPPAGSGPYTIARYTAATWDADGNPVAPGTIVVVRNPRYRGTRAARLEGFRYRTGVEATVDDVLAGRVDVLTDGIGPVVDPHLVETYGPGSARPQLLVSPILGYRFVAIDANRFSVAFRQGVSYALDRPALAALFGGLPDDGYLPPGIAGHADGHVYPVDGPDLATAAALLAGGPTAVTLACADGGPSCLLGDEIAAELADVGVEVTVVPLPPWEYYAIVAAPDSPYDLAIGGWFADYPDPAGMLTPMFTPDGGFNLAHLDDPSITARLEAATATAGDARSAAYGAIASDLLELAPLAVMGTAARYDFVAARLGCRVVNPTYGLDLGALCLADHGRPERR